MQGEDRTELPLRASDADREHVAGLLGEALADGRLTADEHAERIDLLYASRTHDELVPLTADLSTGERDVARQRSALPVERVAPQVAILSSSMARPTGHLEGRMIAVGLLGEARGSKSQDRHLVLLAERIFGNEGQIFAAGLRHQHPVERVQVNQRQAPGSYSVNKSDGKFPEPAVTNALGQILRSCDLAECLLDRDLPDRGRAHAHIGLVV
jgi:hypothetical protein